MKGWVNVFAFVVTFMYSTSKIYIYIWHIAGLDGQRSNGWVWKYPDGTIISDLMIQLFYAPPTTCESTTFLSNVGGEFQAHRVVVKISCHTLYTRSSGRREAYIKTSELMLLFIPLLVGGLESRKYFFEFFGGHIYMWTPKEIE